MLQRGRKPPNDSVVAIARPARVLPPSSLSKPERNMFNQLVDSTDPRHFVESDVPLLICYVQAAILAQTMADTLTGTNVDPNAATNWERAVRVMAMLATRLRLAPQARLSAKAVGTFSGRQSNQRKLWQDAEDEHEGVSD